MIKKSSLAATLLLFLCFSWAQPSVLPNSVAEYLAFREEGRIPIISAHRGGRFLPLYPENALETFDYVLRHAPALIECDINMTKDSVLILLHDNSLNRTTTGKGRVDSTNWEGLRSLQLVDDYGRETPFHIPLLKDVLHWCKGRTVLTLDVKRGVPFSNVIAAIDSAGVADYTVVITYNLEDALEVYRLAPGLMISANIRNEAELKKYLDSGIPARQLLAFTGLQERSDNFYDALHRNGILAIIGTMGNLDTKAMVRGSSVYLGLFQSGADIFATDYPIEIFQAFRLIGR